MCLKSIEVVYMANRGASNEGSFAPFKKVYDALVMSGYTGKLIVDGSVANWKTVTYGSLSYSFYYEDSSYKALLPLDPIEWADVSGQLMKTKVRNHEGDIVAAMRGVLYDYSRVNALVDMYAFRMFLSDEDVEAIYDGQSFMDSINYKKISPSSYSVYYVCKQKLSAEEMMAQFSLESLQDDDPEFYRLMCEEGWITGSIGNVSEVVHNDLQELIEGQQLILGPQGECPHCGKEGNRIRCVSGDVELSVRIPKCNPCIPGTLIGEWIDGEECPVLWLATGITMFHPGTKEGWAEDIGCVQLDSDPDDLRCHLEAIASEVSPHWCIFHEEALLDGYYSIVRGDEVHVNAIHNIGEFAIVATMVAEAYFGRTTFDVGKSYETRTYERMYTPDKHTCVVRYDPCVRTGGFTLRRWSQGVSTGQRGEDEIWRGKVKGHARSCLPWLNAWRMYATGNPRRVLAGVRFLGHPVSPYNRNILCDISMGIIDQFGMWRVGRFPNHPVVGGEVLESLHKMLGHPSLVHPHFEVKRNRYHPNKLRLLECSGDPRSRSRSGWNVVLELFRIPEGSISEKITFVIGINQSGVEIDMFLENIASFGVVRWYYRPYTGAKPHKKR